MCDAYASIELSTPEAGISFLRNRLSSSQIHRVVCIRIVELYMNKKQPTVSMRYRATIQIYLALQFPDT